MKIDSATESRGIPSQGSLALCSLQMGAAFGVIPAVSISLALPG